MCHAELAKPPSPLPRASAFHPFRMWLPWLPRYETLLDKFGALEARDVAHFAMGDGADAREVLSHAVI